MHRPIVFLRPLGLRLGFLMIKNREKIAEKEDNAMANEEGIKVGKAYDFLFEGENKDYDEEYADYI